MTLPWRKLLRIEALLVLLLAYPFLPFVEHGLFELTHRSIGSEMTTISRAQHCCSRQPLASTSPARSWRSTAGSVAS